jgi:hypothetical protein
MPPPLLPSDHGHVPHSHFFLTREVKTCRKDLLDKLIGSESTKKLSVSWNSQNVITVFTMAHHLSHMTPGHNFPPTSARWTFIEIGMIVSRCGSYWLSYYFVPSYTHNNKFWYYYIFLVYHSFLTLLVQHVSGYCNPSSGTFIKQFTRLRINIHVFFLCMFRSFNWYIPLKVSHQNFVRNSLTSVDVAGSESRLVDAEGGPNSYFLTQYLEPFPWVTHTISVITYDILLLTPLYANHVNHPDSNHIIITSGFPTSVSAHYSRSRSINVILTKAH